MKKVLENWRTSVFAMIILIAAIFFLYNKTITGETFVTLLTVVVLGLLSMDSHKKEVK